MWGREPVRELGLRVECEFARRELCGVRPGLWLSVSCGCGVVGLIYLDLRRGRA